MLETQDVYNRLPTVLQHAAISATGFRVNRRRYGPVFERMLEEAKRRAAWSADEIAAYRDARLRRFIRHSISTVPYYRDLSKALSIRPEQIQTLDDLQILPILEKVTVQDNPAMFESAAVSRRARIGAHTSGSTGAGLRFTSTREALFEQWAVWWRYRNAHGIQRRSWCAYFGGRSVVALSRSNSAYWRYNLPARQILFSGYHLSPTTVVAYVRELRRWRVPWLHGYPSLLSLIAAHVQDIGGLGYEVKWVTTGAENLLPQQASAIRAAFGVEPLEHYGLAEAVANASMCPQGLLHVDEDFAGVELLPISGTNLFRIVGTNLSNPSTPLLRYDTGDVVTGGFSSCDCGLPGRALRAIDGRREDYVVLQNGARVGRLDHAFKDLVNIREAQIYQTEPGAIVVRVVKGGQYDASDEGTLLRELSRRLTPEMRIGIEYVTNLERTATGKLRLVTSDLKGGQLSTGPEG